MESMRDTKRIMEREIKKGSTPLTFEQMEIDTENYQEITSEEKLTEVLQYLHRVGNYKSLAGKTVINNVYTFMRGRTPDFTRATVNQEGFSELREIPLLRPEKGAAYGRTDPRQYHHDPKERADHCCGVIFQSQ